MKITKEILSGETKIREEELRYLCKNHEKYDLTKLDVSEITNMEGMFTNATTFNQDIRGWNVGEVTNMEGMFANAFAFNRNIRGWNIGKVTNMTEMFYGARAFNQNADSWGWKQLK